MVPPRPPPLPNRFHVLLLEPDDGVAVALTAYLERNRLRVSRFADGRAGLAEALRGVHDVIALELALPGLPGMEVCQRVREWSQVPVLVHSGLAGEADRVRALEGGADDFLAKPASHRELLARLRALVRRSQGGLAPEVIEVGRLRVGLASRSATLDGRSLTLTSTEFCLLRALAERAGTVLSREQLLDLVRGDAEVAFDRAVDAHVCRLRQKLGDDPKSPRLLRTVRGSGYLLAAEDRAGA